MRLAAVAALLAVAAAAEAQTAGGLGGRVVDARSGKPVAGALVTVSGPSLQGEQKAGTSEDGAFEIGLLPPGTYTVTVERQGFQSFTQEGLTVHAGQTVEMRLSIVPESNQGMAFRIVPQIPEVPAATAETGGVVTAEQMSLVPYGRDSRGFEEAATAIPGVLADPLGLRIAGAQPAESRWIIDGADVTDPAFNGQGTSLLQDFVQEIGVATGGYRAEHGRSSGGIVNAVTKSGGNDFHGSIFANWLPLEAPRKDSGSGGQTISSRSSLHYDLDVGAELGGPVIRDKLWFYGGFAPQVRSTNVERVVSRLVPGGGREPVDSKSYEFSDTRFQYVGKLTWQVQPDHTLVLSAFGDPGRKSGPMGSLNGNEESFLGEGSTGANDVSVRYAGRLFDSALLVEAMGAWHHATDTASGSVSTALPAIRWVPTLNLFDPRLGAGAGVACAPVAGFDPCPVSSYSTGGFGSPADLTRDRLDGAVKVTHLFHAAGRHQLKYGVDATRDSYTDVRSHSGGAAVDAFDDRYEVRVYGPDATVKTRQVSLAGFVQDTWRPADKWAVDLGVRYERQVMSALELNNVMPRLGLIYDFTGLGLARAWVSFGRYYQQLPLDLADRTLAVVTFTESVYSKARCINADPRSCERISTSPGLTGGAAVDPGLRGMYDDQWGVGGQYQVYRDVVVGLDYLRRQRGRAVEMLSPAILGNPAVSRIYDGVTLSAAKPFSQNYLFSASYTFASWRGADGPPNVFKLDAAYLYEVDIKTNVSVGANFRAAERNPWITTLDLRGGYSRRVSRDYTLGGTVDVLNLFNNRSSLPLSARLGVKLWF
jgi:hypothetical protein